MGASWFKPASRLGFVHPTAKFLLFCCCYRSVGVFPVCCWHSVFVFPPRLECPWLSTLWNSISGCQRIVTSSNSLCPEPIETSSPQSRVIGWPESPDLASAYSQWVCFCMSRHCPVFFPTVDLASRRVWPVRSAAGSKANWRLSKLRDSHSWLWII